MGYCKHEWQRRSEVLREVFTSTEAVRKDFYVCGRCLKIQQVEPHAEKDADAAA